MDYLALTIDNSPIDIPTSIPSGGLSAIELLARNFMVVFLFLGICFVVIYITWGGLQWIQSEGDKQKLSSAKSRITWAIIGFIILLLSYTFVNAVGYLFKVNLDRKSTRLNSSH